MVIADPIGEGKLRKEPRNLTYVTLDVAELIEIKDTVVDIQNTFLTLPQREE